MIQQPDGCLVSARICRNEREKRSQYFMIPIFFSNPTSLPLPVTRYLIVSTSAQPPYRNGFTTTSVQCNTTSMASIHKASKIWKKRRAMIGGISFQTTGKRAFTLASPPTSHLRWASRSRTVSRCSPV